MSTNADAIPIGATPGQQSPQETVQAFLGGLEEFDYDKVMSLAAPNIRWVNAPITTSANKQQFDKVLRGMLKTVSRFEVQYRDIHERSNGVVYTDRVDTIEVGGLTLAIDVQGEFRVEDGLVAEWVDRFSWGRTIGDIVKGLPGVVAFLFRK